MKNITLSLILLLLFCNETLLHAQVSINANGAEAEPSAMLDVSSTDKGMLIPRMTAQQRDAIANPATSLLVYVSNDSSYYFHRPGGWELLGPAVPQPVTCMLGGTIQDTVNIFCLDSLNGSLDLADNAISMNPAGKVSLNKLDIKDAGPGTQALQFHAANDTDKWLRFQTRGNPSGRVGNIFSNGNADHFFMYANGTDVLRWDVSSQNANNPDVDNGSRVMRFSSSGNLELKGQPILVTGNQAAGRILTSDTDGHASWADLPRGTKVSTRYDNIQATIDGNNSTSWERGSEYTNWLTLIEQGDVINVTATFSAELSGGSGSDPLRFRIAAEGRAGCAANSGGETDELDIYQEVRGHSVQTDLQWTFRAPCSGEYRFTVEVDCSGIDDDVIIDNIQITSIRY